MGCVPKGIDRSSPTYRSLSFEMDSIPKRTQAHFCSMAHGTTHRRRTNVYGPTAVRHV